MCFYDPAATEIRRDGGRVRHHQRRRRKAVYLPAQPYHCHTGAGIGDGGDHILPDQPGCYRVTGGGGILGLRPAILSQAQLLQERFSGREQGEKRFAVSSQHFNFTVLAFSRLVQNFRGPRYSFHFRETTTYEVLEDVSQLRSEVGILALNEDNERFLRRMFGKLGLEFTELKRVQAELFVSAEHPLAGRRFVTVEDVSPYPCITFEQGEHNGQFFFEGLSAVAAQSHKTICVRERATEYQLLRALNGFSPDVGVSAMYREEFVSLPLEPKQFHTIGYILRRDVTPSPMTLEYIQALREAASI